MKSTDGTGPEKSRVYLLEDCCHKGMSAIQDERQPREAQCGQRFFEFLFVCLFKGGVVVLHACLMNRIQFAEFPTALIQLHAPEGTCIIRRQHKSSEGS